MSFLNKFRQTHQKKDFLGTIREHLADLLNTKRGFGSYPDDLGLDSYVYLGTDQKIIKQIIADIQTCFEKYEKRIHHLEVISMPSGSPFYLSFLIKCKIDNQPCSFHLSFSPQNKFYSLEVKDE